MPRRSKIQKRATFAASKRLERARTENKRREIQKIMEKLDGQKSYYLTFGEARMVLHCYYKVLEDEDLDLKRALRKTARLVGRPRGTVARLVEIWKTHGEIRVRGGGAAGDTGEVGDGDGSSGGESGDGGDNSSGGAGESDGEGEGDGDEGDGDSSARGGAGGGKGRKSADDGGGGGSGGEEGPWLGRGMRNRTPSRALAGDYVK